MTASDDWVTNRYTGLFTRFGPILPEAYDPDVAIWAATVGPRGARPEVMHVGGAGWTADQARLACFGEAIERFHTYPSAHDEVVQARFAKWTRDERAIDPERWVLFLDEQYATLGFPFRRFDRQTTCAWVCFREAPSGEAVWVPEDLAYLFPRPGAAHSIAPLVSTGLSCGRRGQPVLLRGLQEVIERDALFGAWWAGYPIEEWARDDVFALLDVATVAHVDRPNLTYRFYRVLSPFSENVTIVTVQGEDRGGWLFSAGAACRELLVDSFRKALLEAIQGRHYARFLRRRDGGAALERERPASFADHAAYYSRHPDELATTVLTRAPRAAPKALGSTPESVATLAHRLGPDRPVLVRHMTPQLVVENLPGWYVLKVVVPGLQPLHGDHRLAHLGGPLWGGRPLADWSRTPPHPFA